MKRRLRIDKDTGKLSLRDGYSPLEPILESMADYVPSPTRDIREEWQETSKEMIFKNEKNKDVDVNKGNFDSRVSTE